MVNVVDSTTPFPPLECLMASGPHSFGATWLAASALLR